MNIYYLGPEGTFTHQAALTYFSDQVPIKYIDCSTVPSVFSHVKSSEKSFGVVPIENSVHGAVIPTLDSLVFDYEGVHVVGEVSIHVSFGIYCKNSNSDISEVISHPHALAQCRQYILGKGLLERNSNSTAGACKIVAKDASENIAAIASSYAADSFGLQVVGEQIEDNKGAVTRFLVLGHDFGSPLSNPRSFIAILPPYSHAGVLSEFCGIFHDNQINIYEIHSRPAKKSLGQYVFILTIGGDVTKGNGLSSLRKLISKNYRIKVMGCYEADIHIHPEAPYSSIPELFDSDNPSILSPKA